MRKLRLSPLLLLCATLAALLSAPAAEAREISYRFVWTGGGGYSMTGAFSFDANLASAEIVTADQVRCFYIEGFKDGVPIGRWALTQKTEQTFWILNFNPQKSQFYVGGLSQRHEQAWNMNFSGNDCGIGGFGFNIGNAAQDLCKDNTLLFASQVPPATPFPAERAPVEFPPDACKKSDLISLAPPPGRGG